MKIIIELQQQMSFLSTTLQFISNVYSLVFCILKNPSDEILLLLNILDFNKTDFTTNNSTINN